MTFILLKICGGILYDEGSCLSSSLAVLSDSGGSLILSLLSAAAVLPPSSTSAKVILYCFASLSDPEVAPASDSA